MRDVKLGQKLHMIPISEIYLSNKTEYNQPIYERDNQLFCTSHTV